MTLRAKLVLATMAVAAATTVLALVAVQVSVEGVQRRAVLARFEATARMAQAVHEARLAAVRATCRRLARSVRLLAGLAEGGAEDAQRIALDELRDLLGGGADPATRARFFRLLDDEGRPLAADHALAGAAPPGLAHALPALGPVAIQRQVTGWLAANGDAVEVVATPIVDPATGVAAGALLTGFPAVVPPEVDPPDGAPVASALWIDGRLVGSEPAEAVRAALVAVLEGWDGAGALPAFAAGGQRWLAFARALETAPGFPPAAQVAIASLESAERERRRLRALVLGAGAGGLALALGLSAALASHLTRPVRALVAGTEAIAAGDYDHRVAVRVRDELGDLARDFNQMAEGLAHKERYRRVLDVVADPAIASDLLAGRLELGGELRDAGVLFCDIRGFTELARRLPARDVVTLLNEHMAAMTRVIHAHGGVVDKFVGDQVMALFGAPRATGDHAARLGRCALALVAERARLNAAAVQPIEVGLGIALGEMVAGCTGAAERLSYTVLGERVNLAARLCQAAGPGEILLDESTRDRLGDEAIVDPLPPIRVKGYPAPVAVFRLRRQRTEGA